MRLIGTIPPGATIGLGVFDGVHLGHRDIVTQSDAVMTLFPHPDRVLQKNAELPYLCSLVELSELLPQLMVLRFSSQTALMSAHEFLSFILDAVKPAGIVCGSDFKFGANQEGTVAYLQQWGVQNGIAITVVSLRHLDGEPIKSSMIRNYIQEGDLERACRLMGHDYPLFGRVVRGKGDGRRLGFPTANLRWFRNKCLPAFGVYEATVEIENVAHLAIVYVGNRPTLNNGFSVEVHIPGWSGGLYGQRLKVWVSRRIRGDQRFSSVDELIAQITRDIAALPKLDKSRNLRGITLN